MLTSYNISLEIIEENNIVLIQESDSINIEVNEENINLEINTVVGAKGEKGDEGPIGQDGDSAYKVWLNEGNTGTEQDFLDSLKASATTDHSELNLDDGTNPHGTTKSDVGLANVDNTSDLGKPISTATQDALDLKYDASNPNGYIDASAITDFETTTELNTRDTNNRNRANHTGTQLSSTISDFDTEVSNNTDVASNTAKVSADGSIATHSDVDLTALANNDLLKYNSVSGNFEPVAQADVGVTDHSALNLDDGTNPHGTTKADVGLGNVDNTSDANKPISSATQTALNDKLEATDIADFETTAQLNARDTANRNRANHTGTQAISTVSGLQSELDGKLESVVAGTNVTIDNTDPVNPIISATSGGGGSNTIVDTRENIISQTPDNGKAAYATDTNEVFIYYNEWLQSSEILIPRDNSMDMGVFQNSNLAGYNDDTITDKRLSNVSVGGNSDEKNGAIRRVFSSSLNRNLLQFWADGQWRTVLTGVNIQADIDENPPDIEFTNFEPWFLSLITGNSDAMDFNGEPLVKQMKIDMGVFSSPVVIDGGTF